MTTWHSEDAPPKTTAMSPGGWLRVILRGVPVIGLLGLGLAALSLLRLIERPLYGVRRPWSPSITQAVCRATLWLMGIGYTQTGKPMKHPGGVVANHASWLDIFVLNAGQRVYFVSKAEVAGWPGIGLLARATGTVFITRNPRDAKAQAGMFQHRLKAGHKLLFFPEGTSTDALRILPFKSTLFGGFFAQNSDPLLHIQPVTISYIAPEGQDVRFYGWWGGMDFAPHLVKLLAAAQQGQVEIHYHPALRISDFATRKDLAAACELAVKSRFRPRGSAVQRGDQ